MARPKNPKKGDTVNSAVAPSTATVASTTATDETTLARTVAPSTVQPVAAKQETKNAKNGDARKPEIVKPEIGKPEIVKKDARANLVPINLDDEIRRLAYLLSERRGFEPGHDAEDWLNAEREVLARYHQQSA